MGVQWSDRSGRGIYRGSAGWDNRQESRNSRGAGSGACLVLTVITYHQRSFSPCRLETSYTPENALTILEKIVLMEGNTVDGRKPATVTTRAAAKRAYSIISWPSSSRCSDFSRRCIDFAAIVII